MSLEKYYNGSIVGYVDFLEFSEPIPFKFLSKQIREAILAAFDEPILNDARIYYSSDALQGIACFTMPYDNKNVLIMSTNI